MKYIVLIISLLITNYLSAQEISKEAMDLMLNAMYEMDKNLLKVDTFVYKETPYVEEDYLNRTTTKDELTKCIDIIQRTGTISIERKNEAPALYFHSELPDNLHKQITDEIKIKLIQHELINSIGDTIKLLNQTVSSSFKEFNIKTYIENRKSNFDSIKGSVKYKIEFLSGYDKIELTKKDIGKEFVLNKIKLKLLDVNGNYLAFETNNRDGAIQAINYTEDSKVKQPYSYAKLSEIKKTDKSIDLNGSGKYSRIIKRPLYELLNSNSSITLEEYRVVQSEEFVERSQKGIVHLSVSRFINIPFL
jgi:hypothetical protein